MGYLITKSLTISLLDVDYSNVINQVNFLTELGVQSFHFDLMDGNFVPNISYGPKFVADIVKHLKKSVDTSAHFMTRNVHLHVDKLFHNPPKRVVFHYEDKSTLKKIAVLNNLITNKGVKLGLAINPSTKLSQIDVSYFSVVSEVLVMTVVPGKGGQTMLYDQLDKVIILDKLKKLNNFDFTITVDGGVNDKTIVAASKYPIDQYVVGSYLWNNIDKARDNLDYLMKVISAANNKI